MKEKLNLSEMLKNDGLSSLIQEEIQNQQVEQNRKIAVGVAQQVQQAVENLRAVRQQEKAAKAVIKKMEKAVESYDKSGDLNDLRKAGFNV